MRPAVRDLFSHFIYRVRNGNFARLVVKSSFINTCLSLCILLCSFRWMRARNTSSRTTSHANRIMLAWLTVFYRASALFLDTMETGVRAPRLLLRFFLFPMQPHSESFHQSVCHTCQCYLLPDWTKFVQFCDNERDSLFEVGHVVCGRGRRSARLSSRHCVEVRERWYVTQHDSLRVDGSVTV